MPTPSTEAGEPAADEIVLSPCVRVCTLDDDDVCLGCFRDLAEICAWGTADSNERRRILEAAAARRDASQQRA